MNSFRVKFILILGLLLSTLTVSAQEQTHPIINAENADHLSVIETLGRGSLTDAAWTADGKTLVVASANGLWLYDAGNLEDEPQFLPSEHGWLRSMATHPTEPYFAAGYQDGEAMVWLQTAHGFCMSRVL